MQKSKNSEVLFADCLSDDIKKYVFGLLPETEQNSGLAVDVFTLRKGLGLKKRSGSKRAPSVDNYWIASLTDRYFRLHHLDFWWVLSESRYRYYERARREGRYRLLRGYDTIIANHGHKYCHLAKQIDLVEVRRDAIFKTSVKWECSSWDVNFHIKDNFMVNADGYFSIKLHTSGQVTHFYSVFQGITELIEDLRLDK